MNSSPSVRSNPDLVVHKPTGWLVDPVAGAVYAGAGPRKGRRLSSTDQNGHLRSFARSAGVNRTWPLRRVVWEAVTGRALPGGMTLVCIDGDKTNISYRNLRLDRLRYVRGGRSLTDAQVKAIMELKGRLTQREVADAFSVTVNYVWELWSGHAERGERLLRGDR